MDSASDLKKQAREEALKDVKLYLANDWDLKEETPEYFLLTRNEASTSGHILVAILTFWWTIGIGNLLYHLSKKKKKKILKWVCNNRFISYKPEHHHTAEVVRGDTNHGSTIKRP